MKITIAQINPIIGDIPGNTQQIIESAKKAVAEKADLLLTPELSLCGYPPRDLLFKPDFLEAMNIALQQLARDLPANLAVLVGTVEKNVKADIAGGKSLYNSIALLSEGKVKQIFHKRLLPTYDVFDEHRYFEPGLEANYFTLNNVKIGVTICEDLWNDEEFFGKRSYSVNPIAELSKSNVDIVVNLSASPYTFGKQHFREAMLKHTAMRFDTPIIYVNQVGGNDDLIFDGRSFALNKRGEVTSRACGFDADLLQLEFDKQNLDLNVGSIAPNYECEDEEIWQALVLGVKDYVQKCRFSKVVLGLSGGIDSSIVAACATAALGKENVLGVLMPSPYSSESSIKDADDLAKNLGIATQKLPIGDLMDSYDGTFTELFANTEFGLAEENIQSRIRGNLLMAISNKFGYLLLSTGNKSEMAVGYCTLYGDMNGGLAVIADVPKTRVYSICHWLNRNGELIPQNVLVKPPSAELKPNQVDRDSLPDYEILDDILQRLINDYQSAEQIIAAGHDAAVVNRIIQMVTRAEFKRRQAPPGIKITDRAFGTGWRMPIANNWLAIKNVYKSKIVSVPNSTSAEENIARL